MGLDVPVYFSAGLTARANEYYKLFINWTNQKIKQSFVDRNMFEFSHIQAFDPAYASEPRAMYVPDLLLMRLSSSQGSVCDAGDAACRHIS